MNFIELYKSFVYGKQEIITLIEERIMNDEKLQEMNFPNNELTYLQESTLIDEEKLLENYSRLTLYEIIKVGQSGINSGKCREAIFNLRKFLEKKEFK